MNDRPTAAELVEGVRRFLEADLLPTLTDPRLRFQTLIAANVLAIAGRELSSEEDLLREEHELLTAILAKTDPPPQRLAELREAVREANRQLCERIRGGDFEGAERFRALAAMLRRLVVRKLEVANPRYLAGAVKPR
ncbi:MAG TPA: DUF6285 domain-containing protein [Gemmataceae bacterium]|jgi:hypothetical protein